MKNEMQSIVLGAGCFWCSAAVFQRIDGVLSVTAGYAGGKRENPAYEQVSTGISGHAEVIQIEFNPRIITFDRILDIFFSSHDPTTLNRQGADTGTQYRSIILYRNDDQKISAERKIGELNSSGIFRKEIVTEVKPLDHFWPAEDAHQDYFEKHPFAAYCRIVIEPKLAKLALPEKAKIVKNNGHL